MDVLAALIEKDVDLCPNGPWMLPEATPLPSGREAGTVLVIGVGGSTLRLREVCVQANRSESSTEPGSGTSGLPASERVSTRDIVTIPITAEARAAPDLFAWFAAQLVPALQRYQASSQSPEKLRLAVSWSFPLLNGRILSMGKAFGTRYDGGDVRALFDAALPVDLRVASVIHDGTSSLVAGAHASPECVMALTLGTGVNINVAARASAYTNALTDSNTAGVQLINTEISMLGRPDTTPHIALTKERFDVADARADFQPFEAQVGGMYLGEIVSRALGKPVETPEIWRVLARGTGVEFCVVEAVVDRAVALVAAAIVGLLRKFHNPLPGTRVEVAYTGGVVFEQEFRCRLTARLFDLTDFELILVPQEFGSEVGAAIAALAR